MQHWTCESESIITLLLVNTANHTQCNNLSPVLSLVLYKRGWIFPPWSVWGLPIIWLWQYGKGAKLEHFERHKWGCRVTVLPLRGLFAHVPDDCISCQSSVTKWPKVSDKKGKYTFPDVLPDVLCQLAPELNQSYKQQTEWEGRHTCQWFQL